MVLSIFLWGLYSYLLKEHNISQMFKKNQQLLHNINNLLGKVKILNYILLLKMLDTKAEENLFAQKIKIFKCAYIILFYIPREK